MYRTNALTCPHRYCGMVISGDSADELYDRHLQYDHPSVAGVDKTAAALLVVAAAVATVISTGLFLLHRPLGIVCGLMCVAGFSFLLGFDWLMGVSIRSGHSRRRSPDRQR